MSLRARFEKLWCGEHRTSDREHHPFQPLDVIEEVAPGVGFYKGFVNLAVVVADEGAVLLDTGSFHPLAQRRQFEAVRTFTDKRIETAIYTHGHVDHAYGLPPFIEEARARGVAPPRVVAHEAVPIRMRRYIETAGYNAIINSRQFGFATEWPTDPVWPDTTYRAELTLHAGGRELQVFHAKGETDDHSWIYLPDARALYTGDLFIWAAPNAGNPQKAQRYVMEWALALRAMAELRPVVLMPGHGLPVFGEAEVQRALLETAEFLDAIHDQTLALLNQGATIYDIIHGLKVPAHLAERPYLRPVYDEPEFIARNLHRRYGGWYSGVPCELKPAEPARQANEIVGLAGGADKLLERARALLEAGDLRLCCHLVDWAVQAEPDNRAAHELRAEVYRARASSETSTMAKGIFREAAATSARKGGNEGTD